MPKKITRSGSVSASLALQAAVAAGDADYIAMALRQEQDVAADSIDNAKLRMQEVKDRFEVLMMLQRDVREGIRRNADIDICIRLLQRINEILSSFTFRFKNFERVAIQIKEELIVAQALEYSKDKRARREFPPEYGATIEKINAKFEHAEQDARTKLRQTEAKLDDLLKLQAKVLQADASAMNMVKKIRLLQRINGALAHGDFLFPQFYLVLRDFNAFYKRNIVRGKNVRFADQKVSLTTDEQHPLILTAFNLFRHLSKKPKPVRKPKPKTRSRRNTGFV